MAKRTTTISIPETLWLEFDKYCKIKGFKKSTLIQMLIKEKMEK